MTTKMSSIILLRVTRVGDRERAFADELEKGSSFKVAYLVDGRHGNVPSEARPIIALNDQSCRDLGLPIIDFYPWRCGDFGVYLARSFFPDAPHFWLIEGDVRFSCDSAPFFNAMAESNSDLLAANLRISEEDWFWTDHSRGRNVVSYRCLYSAIRLSARLVDAMLDKRQAHGKSLFRRSLWSNDESFTCTTAMNGDFIVSDFNDVEGPWYSRDLFDYNVTLDGDNLPGSKTRPQLLHSVRYGSDITSRKTHPNFKTSWHFNGRRKIARHLLRHRPW